MKLKDYIEILQAFDQDVEVLKKTKVGSKKVLITLNKRSIIKPHVHFKYDPVTGHETLVDAIVV